MKSIRNQALLGPFYSLEYLGTSLPSVLVYFSGKLSGRWPPASLCLHPISWAMPAEDRAPFPESSSKGFWSCFLLAWLVFPAHRWSDSCGQWNSVVSLPRPESHLTFRAESHGLRVGWYQKKMRCFYQKTDKGYWASRRSFPLYQRNGQSGEGLWRRQAGRKRICAGWWGY